MGIRTLLGLLWNWCLLIHLHYFRGRSPCWNLHNLNSLQSKRPRRPPSSHYPGHLQPRILWQQSPLPWFLRLCRHCSPGADVDIEQQWPWTVNLANFKTLRLYLLISPAPGVAATETWTLHSDIQTFRSWVFPSPKRNQGGTMNKAANFRESSNATKKQCQLLSLKRLHPRQQSHQLRPPKTKHLHGGIVPIESNWLHKIGYIPWLWNLKSWVLHKFPSP